MDTAFYLIKAKRWLAIVFASLSLIALIGCEDDALQQHSSDELEDNQPSFAIIKPVPQSLQDGMPVARPTEMLSVADPTPPEQWLLTLYLLKPDADITRSSSYYQKLLSSIKAHVHDHPRVIANRTVQTTRQLQELGFAADEDQILEDFAERLQHVSVRYIYGDLCANYSNLRQQQLSHQEAMQNIFNE